MNASDSPQGAPATSASTSISPTPAPFPGDAIMHDDMDPTNMNMNTNMNVDSAPAAPPPPLDAPAAATPNPPSLSPTPHPTGGTTPMPAIQTIDLTVDSDSDSPVPVGGSQRQSQGQGQSQARRARVAAARAAEAGGMGSASGVYDGASGSGSAGGGGGMGGVGGMGAGGKGAGGGGGSGETSGMGGIGGDGVAPAVSASNGVHARAGTSDSDDDFTITASTGPTLAPAHRMRGAMPRTQGRASNHITSSSTSASPTLSHLASSSLNGNGSTGLSHSHSHLHHSSSSPSSTPEQRLAQQQQLAHTHRFINNNALASASAAAHGAGSFYRNHPSNFAPSGAFGGSPSASPSFGNIAVPALIVPSLPSVPGVPGVPSLPGFAPYRNGKHGDGSASAPIDVDKVPANPAPPRNMSKPVPICIGGFMSRAIMLYPKTAVTAGEPTPPGSSEMWEVVHFRGVEMLRVRLKLRKAGSIPRPDEPWSATNVDTIQVMTPNMGTYIGDLDAHTADILIPMLKRGLCRLEGFAVRLAQEMAQYECKVNVLIFTLPSNVRYIADTLLAHSLYLLDPLPTYDPTRHSDHPEYHNAHGSGERALQLYQAHRRSQHTNNGSAFNPAADKARQVEVQRKQAEAILDQLTDGVELEQSDPGPWIRTELFPHQRRALTFLLQGEQDTKSLKEARKIADRKLGLGKSSKKDGSSKESSAGPAGERSEKEGTSEPKAKEKEKDSKNDFSRSLWEGEKDEKGRLRIWKNKVTGEKVRLKKNERPQDAKGAILADDMGLGKTLSVVSLIAATRGAAKEWASRPLDVVAPVDGDASKLKSDIDASSMMTKVFGMPDADTEIVNGNGKKRRREEPSETEISNRIRRARIVKRAKGTLLVCPMSTMTNWEDQIKEHWDGKVVVIGGTSSSAGFKNESKTPAPEDKEFDEYDTIKVYIYHGASRNMDPRFLAEFDIVVTSYSTLANEYSKQCATCFDDESTPLDTGAANSDDEGTPGNPTGIPASRSSRGTKTPDGDFKPSELAEALIKKGKGKKKPLNASGEQPSALQSIDWFRVVLDEAHSIKSASTIACKASCALEADRRVALTGTPIQNRVEDVWALFKFLRMSPIDEREVFTKYITTPCKTGEQVGVARLQLIMRTCTLRRTKDTMTEGGQKILDLPARREIQVWLDLRDDERKIYDERHEEIKQDIMELQEKKQLTKNYAHVLQHLLRLRQTCDHVDLPSSGPVEEDYDGTIMDYELALQGIEKYGLSLPRAQSVISFQKDSPDGAVCAECAHDFGPLFPSIGLGGAEDEMAKPPPEAEGKKAKKPPRPVLTKCLHIMCPTCFKRSVHSTWPKKVAGISRQCGVCEKMLRLDLDAMEVTPPNSDEPEDQPKKVVRRKKWARKDGEDISLSTKMEWLRTDLMRFSKVNPASANYEFYSEADRPMPFNDRDGNGFDSMQFDAEGTPIPSKCIVFSQWTTMLDRIEDMLREIKINYCRLDGTMTREQRAQAMDDLRTKRSIEVMLVSTRAGGVGLNLTSASRAYLVDPYWNPSVEAQAIDRVHRMGQKQPVTAVRLMIKSSVEEKLAQIQKKKADLADLSLKNMSRKELMEQKAEALADLFR